MGAETSTKALRLTVIDDPASAPRCQSSIPARMMWPASRRWRTLLLTLMHADAPVCACNLLPAVGVGQATVSHHLKVLREAGLVAVDRRGIWAHYEVVPTMREWLRAILA